MNTSSPLQFMLSLALSLPVTAPLAAQNPNCAVRSAYQMGNMAGGFNIHQVDTGWQLPTATTNQQNGGGTPGQGLYSVGSVQTQAEFGRLRIQGSGQAQNWNGFGTTLYVVQTSSDTPTVRFRDTLLVQSQGLPAGTPVQIRARVRLTGIAEMVGLMPFASFGAQIRVDTQSTGLGLGSVVAALNSTTGLATAIVPTTVGAILFVEGRTTVDMQEIGVMNSLPATGSYSINLESVFEFQSLTSGASIAYCSAGSYPSLSASTRNVGVGCGAAPPTLSSTLPLLGSTVSLRVRVLQHRHRCSPHLLSRRQ